MKTAGFPFPGSEIGKPASSPAVSPAYPRRIWSKTLGEVRSLVKVPTAKAEAAGGLCFLPVFLLRSGVPISPILVVSNITSSYF